MAKRFAVEQFPPDAAWIEHADRVRELAAYEAAFGVESDAMACVPSSASVEGRIDAVCARVDALVLESPATVSGVGTSEDDDEDERDEEDGASDAVADDATVVVLEAVDDDDDDDDEGVDEDRIASTEMCSSSSPSFDERDVVFETTPERDDAPREHRVVVVPKVLILDDTLPQSNTVSFVPPREAASRKLTGKITKASAYWRNVRGGNDGIDRPIVVRFAPPTPLSPQCATPSPPAVVKTLSAYPETPPWYVKKFNAETRELQKTARTLIDWTTETFNELCPDLDDFTYTLSWFDTAEAAVAGPSRFERAKLE
ncbi:unnamed product [Ostreococcus tauri]|uniref:Unnamed product n=1 Tax=Ostreococcus tauri TaxID=70448 RepID=A0A090LXQ2_OSTTA|nr:unnamed product [Ostreococcus tauri]CEF96586.1 unnamed product [Ostreococcus tauri]|eukprot:XP_022838176.1 unnamed product [Ostreococcus tauri]